VSITSPPDRVLQVTLLWLKEKREMAALPPINVDPEPPSDEGLMELLKVQGKDALAELVRRYWRQF